ncbi:CHAT domain-containing protein [Acidobacteriota bacterium]
MNSKHFKKRVKLILILFLFYALSNLVLPRDKQVDESKQLREGILAAYKSGGEQGLRDFVKKQKDKISNKFIVDFAEAGKKERKEEWLKVSLFMARGQKDGKTPADVLYKTGEYFLLISDNKKAFDYFEKALPIYVKLNDLVGQGNVYLSKGTIYYYTGDNSGALEMYNKALLFFKKAENPIGQGNVYRGKGDIYSYTGDNPRALEMYDKALVFYEKAGAPIGQGNVYMSKGDTYFYTGDYPGAIELYEKALYFYEKGGDIIGQGIVYMGKGDIYLYTGAQSKALEMYDKALPFFEKMVNLLGQGNMYLRKGDCYLNTYENSKALKMYDKALFFYEKVKEPIGQGNVYLGKGDIYLRIGGCSKALEMYDKALPFFEKVVNPLGQGNVNLRKGVIYLHTGDYSKALMMYDKALPFYERVGAPLGQGNVYRRKGEIYLYTGDYSRALAMYDKALPFFEKAGEPRGPGNVYREKGKIYFLIGDYSKSFEMYNKALLFCKKSDDIEAESYALHGKAKVFAQQGKTDDALALFEKDMANLEKVRTRTAFSEMKRTFMEKVYVQYEETVLFMMENKYYDKGFKYAESMRARVFLDRIVEGFVRLDKGLAADLKKKRNRLVAKLSLITKEMHKTAAKNNEKKLHELKEQYRKVENEFEELLIKIRLDNPVYALVRYPQPVSVQDVQEEILEKGEMLLRYFITPQKVYVFIISKENFKVVPINVNEKEINKKIEFFLRALKEHNFSYIKRYGNTLYEKLFKPLEPALEINQDIIIIPDGQLAKIPFESLIINNKDKESGQFIFLLEKYHIKYIQSASVLSVLRRYYRRDSETKSFIGFGDPVYDYDNFKQGKPELGSPDPVKGDEITGIHRGKYHREGGKLVRLQGSGEEVKTIFELFKKKNQKSVVQLRTKATEENARAMDMKEFDYIHFACHGILGENFQSLVLSQLPPEETPEDGYFTLNEIMNCDYNAKLVVLSACQTGSGRMEKAEGVTGLTRAVMYAGTPAVMASLWKVDDMAAKELMVKFYRNMLEKNLDKTEALRQAKLALLKNKKYTSPLYWSAFVMYGE